MVATSEPGPESAAGRDQRAPSDNDSTSASDEAAEPSASTDVSGDSPTAATPPTRSGAPDAESTESTRRARTRRSRPSVDVSRDQVRAAVNGVRERLAALVWILVVIAAVILAGAALLIALDANPNNELVEQVIAWAHDLDGPFFDMFTFSGDNAETKRALVNWGLAAVAWLVAGKVVSAIIRP